MINASMPDITLLLDIVDREKIAVLNIALASNHQKAGVGSSLINNCIEKFHPKEIIAETDDDAIGFLSKIWI